MPWLNLLFSTTTTEFNFKGILNKNTAETLYSFVSLTIALYLLYIYMFFEKFNSNLLAQVPEGSEGARLWWIRGGHQRRRPVVEGGPVGPEVEATCKFVREQIEVRSNAPYILSLNFLCTDMGITVGKINPSGGARIPTLRYRTYPYLKIYLCAAELPPTN